MKILVVCIFLLNLTLTSGQVDSTKSAKHNLYNINGIWIVDLRPSPESDPYYKDFIIKYEYDNKFSGVFYDTEFDIERTEAEHGTFHEAKLVGLPDSVAE